jgi:hypothetical protein
MEMSGKSEHTYILTLENNSVMKKNFLKSTMYAFAKAFTILTLFVGCQPDDSDLPEATFPNIAEVFTDVPVNLTDQFFVSFDPNAGANTLGFGTDNTVAFEGTTSIRIDVPAPDDPNGNFIGGIFLDRGAGRNLTAYNTLSFYAFSSVPATIEVGFGTDFETNTHAVNTTVNLSTGWNRYFIPIPNSDRLLQEKGMFLFAAGTGSTGGDAFTFWLDEIRFDQTNLVALNGATIFGGQDQVTAANIGSTVTVTDTFAEFNTTSNPAGNSQITMVTTTPGYFDFTSSNEDVATVDESGVITILSDTSPAIITATLDGNTVQGSLTIMPVDAGNNVDDSGNTQVMLPIGFESSTLAYNPTEFGGAPSSVAVNPSVGGLNNSTNALQTVKAVGSETFAGIFMDLDVAVDFSENQQVSALVFAPQAGTDVLLAFENAATGQASQVAVTSTTTIGNQWEELVFDFSAIDPAVAYDRLVLIYDNGTAGDNSTYFIDDIQTTGDGDGDGGGDDPGDNLLENGDFEQGMVAWIGNAFNVQTDGGNSFNFADVATAGNAFDVNLSQQVAIEAGETYTLTFDASTGAGQSRTMVAGIGLNEAPFISDTETVNLTETLQTFELTFTASFGLANSRVLFDMGAETGVVVIDNVSLVSASGGGGGGGDNVLDNADFEQGMVIWEGNAFNVQTDGGNSFNFADVATAGNPFDVNLSQGGLDISEGETWTLSFDASTDGPTGSRTMIVGIGLFEAPFTNQSEEVTITSTSQTYTVELTANFTSAGSRVLFDMGADTGVVVIDNVSLIQN